MNSLYNYLLAYENNKDLIKAYLSNKHIESDTETTTNQVDTDKLVNNVATIMDYSIGIFIIGFLISLALWIWAVVILVKYWNQLPNWAKVLGIIGVLPVIPGGSIMTIIVVYIGKGQQ